MKSEGITKSMTVTYEVGDGLYINLTNGCTNRCDFCIRNNGDGAYGSDSLWLEREPTETEVLESVFSHDLSSYKEIVFCGYGEPSLRLGVARNVALAIKEKYPAMHVRINTNGQSDLIFKRDTAKDYEGAFDSVSISLNAPTAQKYQEICHSVFGDEVLDRILKFAQNVKKYVQNTAFSVVGDFLSSDEIEECYKISERTGVPLRVREYIS